MLAKTERKAALVAGIRAKVYWNLREDTFSIVALEGEFKGLVCDFSDDVSLTDVVFHVNQNGRDRTLKAHKHTQHAEAIGKLVSFVKKGSRKDERSIHAWACGRLSTKPHATEGMRRITYNPYYKPEMPASFRYRDSDAPIATSPKARFLTRLGVNKKGQPANVADCYAI